MKTVAAALALVPSRLPSRKLRKRERWSARQDRRSSASRCMLGCVQEVLAALHQPRRHQAAQASRRRGGDVKDEACCGALQHQLGREEDAREAARRNVDAWTARMREGSLDAILVTASGCGTMVKDYGNLLARDRGYAERATDMSRLARDITEFIDEIGLLPPLMWTGPQGRLSLGLLAPAWPARRHTCRARCCPKPASRCSRFPRAISAAARPAPTTFSSPSSPANCASASCSNIASVKPDVIATGNIGCMMQLQRGSSVPVVHTVELLDWATGGPCPKPLEKLKSKVHPIESLIELAAHGDVVIPTVSTAGQ